MRVDDIHGAYWFAFGTTGSGTDQFGYDPGGIAMDASGNLIIADSGNNRIVLTTIP